MTDKDLARDVSVLGLGRQSKSFRRLVLLGAAGLLGVLLMMLGSMWESRSAGVPGRGGQAGGALGDLDLLPAPAAPGDAALDPALSSLERQLSQRLEEVLGHMDGIGQVRVMVTLAASSQRVFAQEIDESQRAVTETDAHGGRRSTEEASSRRQPAVMAGARAGADLLVSQIQAAPVRGVLVVAEGARDPSIRLQLVRVVQSVMDVPAHKIQVVPGRSEDK